MKQIKTQKSSFALVYVLIFTMMILMIVVMISGSLVANLRLQRSSHSSIQAYNLARSAVDEAWGKYKTNLTAKEAALTIPSYNYTSETEIYTDPTANNIYKPYLIYKYPDLATACVTTAGATYTVHRIDLNQPVGDPGREQDVLNTAPITSPNNAGIYDYRVCYDGSLATSNKFIKTVGYYQGTKIALQAVITHKSLATPIPNDYYTAMVTIGKTAIITNPNPPPTTLTVCDGYDSPRQCGNDPNISGLPLCTSFTNPSQCDATSPKKLDTIHFNHSSDKLDISQISLL